MKKFQVVIKIGKFEKVKDFDEFTLASKEFETLKRMNAQVQFIVDGKDISDTIKIEPVTKPEEVVKAATFVEADVFFFWKEGDVKKMTKVKESRAKTLLARAEKAGFAAFITDQSKKVIAKVNC